MRYHPQYFEIVIPSSKTDQIGNGQETLLVKHEGMYDPHMLLCMYIQVLSPNGDDSYIFPPLKYDSSVKSWSYNNFKQMSYSAAYGAFKKFVSNFGLDPKTFSLHSPRVGGTTSLFQKNIPKRIIDKLGRWKSTRTKYIYGRDKKRYIAKQLMKKRF